MSTGPIVAVLVAIVAGGLAIWLVPQLQVGRWRRAGISDEEKLAELGVQARSSITQALGGLALIVTLAITAYQANATRRSAQATQQSADKNLTLATEGQVSEQFSRAIGQLGTTNPDGSAAIDVRTGGLYSLRRIGQVSDAYRQPAFFVVAAYVRNNYASPEPLRRVGCQADFSSQRPDIATALASVLPVLAAKLLGGDKSGSTQIGLRGAKLNGFAFDGLRLERFDLSGIQFRNASLNDSDFRKARLVAADFTRACLHNADFRLASLNGAHFRGAQLRGATFTRDAFNQAAPALSPAQKREVKIVSG